MGGSSRLALVTGASRGIGRAIAKSLADDGWRPLIHYNSGRSAAESSAAECGGLVPSEGHDLSTLKGCRALWEWATECGQVAALVNNAGIYRQFEWCDADDGVFEDNWRSHLDTNLLGPARLSRMFAISANPGARILNVASRVGFKGEAGAAAYAASKAGLIALTRSLAVELAGKVRVNGIAPGWVQTAMTRPNLAGKRDRIESDIPLGRVATVEDCAAAARFLLSDEAAYLSGVVIDVNGASYFH